MGFRSNAEAKQKWAALSERSQQRAQERQAWADEAEKRYQQRMSEFREKSQIARQEYAEQQRRMWEEAQMITTMLDALCELDISAHPAPKHKSSSLKSKLKVKRYTTD